MILQMIVVTAVAVLQPARFFVTNVIHGKSLSKKSVLIQPLSLSRREQDIKSMEKWRKLRFWSKVVTIYGSYKAFQTKRAFNRVFERLRNNSSSTAVDLPDLEVEKLHELNSERMLQLCLSLRGFYLKSGQFLGTRHDFMPPQYTSKLQRLQDDVPAMPAEDVQCILSGELGGEEGIERAFSALDINSTIGCASIAQVHKGIWRETQQVVAVKIQNPDAQRLMARDLRNLRVLAEFLQKTELKFDILSAVKELQRQIHREFDFRLEAQNMGEVGSYLEGRLPGLKVPKAVFASKKLLVMTFLNGENLGKLATSAPSASTKRQGPSFFVRKVLYGVWRTLAEAWGMQIFELNRFHADPHPGNLLLDPAHPQTIALLDWGQVKTLARPRVQALARLVLAMAQKNDSAIAENFRTLGVRVRYPDDENSITGLAITMFDTRNDVRFPADPFSSRSLLRRNSVLALPTDLYFLVRSVQLLRGLARAIDRNEVSSSAGDENDDALSLSAVWRPYAQRALEDVRNADNKPTSMHVA